MADQSSSLNRILGPLERQIMKVIWDRGNATVQEVVDQLSAEKSYAYTTIMTIMTRLTEKGYLTKKKEGRKYRYQAAYSPDELIEQYSSRQVQRLLDDFGEVAISQFVDQASGSLENRRRLKALLKQLEQEESEK